MRRPRPAPWLWLLLSTGVAVIAFISATVYAWQRASSIDDLAEDIAENADPSIRYLDDARTELHAMTTLVTAGLLDPSKQKPFPHGEFERSRAGLHQDIAAYLHLPFFPRERSRWQDVESDVARAESRLDEIARKLEANDVAGAMILRDGGLSTALQRADVAPERFAGTLRRELLDHVLTFSEPHLRPFVA